MSRSITLDPQHLGLVGPLPGRRGVALLSVLWILTLLALLAATVMSASRTETSLARNLLDNARAEALADAGVHMAAAGLTRPDEAARWTADGRVYTSRLAEGEIHVTVLDEIGKIDLNRAQDELLQSLFEQAGLTADEAAALVDAVVDYRDPDSLRRLSGAEDEDYLAAGLPQGAKDAPFEMVEELQQVLGMTDELYARVAAVVTVDSGRPGLNPYLASRAALLSIPGIDVAEVDRFLDARTETGFDRSNSQGAQPTHVPHQTTQRDDRVSVRGEESEAEGPTDDRTIQSQVLPGGPGVNRYFTFGTSRGTYSVHSEGRTDAGGVFVRRSVVKLEPDSQRGFSLRAWSQGKREILKAERP